MTLRDTMEIDVDNVPYSFNIDLDGNNYNMALSYNDICSQYVIDIYDSDYNSIYIGEPIVLNQPLWRNISDDRLPITPIVPMDEAGLETRVNIDNFGNSVVLCFNDLDGDNSD